MFYLSYYLQIHEYSSIIIDMNTELQEISKTIPLQNSHDINQFNILTQQCPKQLIIIDYFGDYTLKACTQTKKIKNTIQGIFDYLIINIYRNEITHQNNQYDYWININANNIGKFIVGRQIVEGQQGHKYNQNVDFDRKILDVLRALNNSSNYQFNGQKCLLAIKCKRLQLQISLKQDHLKSKHHITQRDTVNYIKTRQYLNKIETQMTNYSMLTMKNQSPLDKQIQNQILTKKLANIEKQLSKNTYYIDEALQQLKSVKRQIMIHGEKMQIQQNKLMKIWDDLSQLKKQNQDHLGVAQKKKIPIHSPVTVPDFLREKLAIDLHSSYLGKFDVHGSQIIYKGQDKQATQLLSNKIFGAKQKYQKLKSSMKVIKTKSKCIKMGIIDNKYVNERSCWNFPNVAYLHGWGHTMVSGKQEDHQFCDFGSGDIVEMQVDFVTGHIKWMINNKTGVKLHTEPVRKLLKSDIEWTPFIAMYNYLDCVEWDIKQI